MEQGYGILPLEAATRMHELSGVQWKVYSYYLARRNLLTRQCNPSHELISRQCKIHQTSVSTIKKELEGAGWLKRRGKYAVVLLVGAEELERARDEAIARKLETEGARLGRERPQDTGASFELLKATADAEQHETGASFEKLKGRRRKRRAGAGASFELFKGSDSGEEKNESPALNNSNALDEQRRRTEKKAAAAATARDAWLSEPVTQAFIDDIISRGLYSREVVEQSWRELAFKVAQRGPDARAEKGELLAFCRAKAKSGVLPGVEKPDVSNMRVVRSPAQAGPKINCESSCELCFGGQRQSVPGKGSRPCPNREARRAAARQTEGGAG
jgi:hypothetical protein